MSMQIDVPVLERPLEADKKRASGLHSYLASRIAWLLRNHITPRKLGWIIDSSATYNFQDGGPKRQPDVSFVPKEKGTVMVDEELTVIPDLAVEIVSKNDTGYEIIQKVNQYQRAGVKLVWIVYPSEAIQHVMVYTLADGLAGQGRKLGETLDGGNVLPGFQLPVQTIFENELA
jgi:Uma2 family endonuclease